jgi:hypothetical protein
VSSAFVVVPSSSYHDQHLNVPENAAVANSRGTVVASPGTVLVIVESRVGAVYCSPAHWASSCRYERRCSLGVGKVEVPESPGGIGSMARVSFSLARDAWRGGTAVLRRQLARARQVQHPAAPPFESVGLGDGLAPRILYFVAPVARGLRMVAPLARAPRLPFSRSTAPLLASGTSFP